MSDEKKISKRELLDAIAAARVLGGGSRVSSGGFFKIDPAAAPLVELLDELYPTKPRKPRPKKEKAPRPPRPPFRIGSRVIWDDGTDREGEA